MIKDSLERLPVYDKEAEQSVLGACFHSPDAYYKAIEILNADDFYKTPHRIIFSNLVEWFENNDCVDVISLSELLKRKKVLDSAGGHEYLALLEDYVPTSTAVIYHAKIVKKHSFQRQVQIVGWELNELSHRGAEDIDTVFSEAHKIVKKMAYDNPKKRFDFKDITQRSLAQIFSVNDHDKKHRILSGFRVLDEKLTGFESGELIILGARPSMGKSALSMDIATNIAKQGTGVVFFSLEMKDTQLAQRKIAAASNIDFHKIRTGWFSAAEKDRLIDASRELSTLPIYIDDRSGVTVSEICTRSTRFKMEKDIGFIVIDYLGLIRSDIRSHNKNDQISEITAALKVLAKSLDVPILLLSQLSREVERKERKDKRPILADLRDSGSIEQDADIVLFLYRDAIYNPESDPGDAELIIKKNRNGPSNESVDLTFSPKFVTFT